ncbi:hypothetical protein ACXWOU_09620, partial [Streptococcus pyogenes]
LAISSIVLLLMFRCFVAEYLLSKRLNIDIIQDAFIEIGMSILFIFSGWNLSVWSGVVIYSVSYILYVVYKAKPINNGAKTLKS